MHARIVLGRRFRFLGCLLVALSFAAPAASADIFVKIPGVGGNATMSGYNDGTWFAADSFEWGVDRNYSMSNAKGAADDINIGVASFETLTLKRRSDKGSSALMQVAMNGNSLGTAQLHLVQPATSGKPFVSMIIKLDRIFVKSWSIEGAAQGTSSETLELSFSRIAMANRSVTEKGQVVNSPVSSWDRTKNTTWSAHKLVFPK